LTLSSIERGELFQCTVKLNQVNLLLYGDGESVIERRMDGCATSFLRALPARVINQDPAHHARGNCEKMRAVLPLWVILAVESQVNFMNEGRGLKRVPAALATQMTMSQMPQLVVNDRHKLFQCSSITAAPLP
jgi:hypothetical protein